MKIKVGIIGGTGFYNMEGLENKKEVEMPNEWGNPSDKIMHGKNHSKNPTDVNYRANIRAMQLLGCTHILAATACGSLRENMAPGHFVIPDSFVDRTTKRAQTFHCQESDRTAFSTVAHIPMHPSFCEETRKVLVNCGKSLGFETHNGGTIVTIEGPRFSSRAESNIFRSWNCDVINMTTVPEVVLAAEAGMSYASVAMVTDYDCWRDNEEAVSVEKVMAVVGQNAANVKQLFVKAVEFLGNQNWDELIKANQAKAKGARMN